jgi:RND family efflux transporter MFP subunit
MRHSIWILAAAMLALAGCSGSSGETEQGADPVALVSLAKAGTGDISQTVTLYGEIERGGDSQVVLSAPVEATVVGIEAPAGSAVAAGQIIARLRPSPASLAQYRAASADAVAAGQALARAQRLRADGLGSDAEVEAARSRSAAASALLASLGERNAALILRAPHAGFVDSTGASTGDLVQPGVVVATISRAGGAKARFGIDPARLRGLSAGMPLEIHPGDGSSPFTVPIASISPVAHAQTRLASILVDIPASQGLAAGQPLSARVVTQSTQAAVTIPYAALLDDGGQPFVFVVNGGIARRRDVRIGANDGKTVAVLDGVREGDMILTAGGTAVEDGMKVRTR